MLNFQISRRIDQEGDDWLHSTYWAYKNWYGAILETTISVRERLRDESTTTYLRVMHTRMQFHIPPVLLWHVHRHSTEKSTKPPPQKSWFWSSQARPAKNGKSSYASAARQKSSIIFVQWVAEIDDSKKRTYFLDRQCRLQTFAGTPRIRTHKRNAIALTWLRAHRT